MLSYIVDCDLEKPRRSFAEAENKKDLCINDQQECTILTLAIKMTLPLGVDWD